MALGQELAARARAQLAGHEYALPQKPEAVDPAQVKTDRFAS